MGVGEEIKGKAKEVAGAVSDNDDLRREGKAQVDKGQAEVEAQQARLEAQKNEAEASFHEGRERAARAAK